MFTVEIASCSNSRETVRSKSRCATKLIANKTKAKSRGRTWACVRFRQTMAVAMGSPNRIENLSKRKNIVVYRLESLWGHEIHMSNASSPKSPSALQPKIQNPNVDCQSRTYAINANPKTAPVIQAVAKRRTLLKDFPLIFQVTIPKQRHRSAPSGMTTAAVNLVFRDP